MKYLRTVIILAITAILLILVIQHVGIDELWELLQHANLQFLFFSLIVSFAVIIISAYKWKYILDSKDYHLQLGYLTQLYFVGMFFSNFLPSTVGGDVIRAYELGRKIKNTSEAAASIFIERFTGFIVLILLSLFSFITNIALVQDMFLTMGFVIMTAGLLILLWIILDKRLIILVQRWVKVSFVQKVIGKLQNIQDSLWAYGDDKKSLAIVFLISLLFYIGAIIYVYIATLVFFSEVNFTHIAIITPIIMLISSLPFTFNGIGIQEWAYVALYQWFGMPAAVGLSVIVLVRALTILNSILGGLVWARIKTTDNLNDIAVQATLKS